MSSPFVNLDVAKLSSAQHLRRLFAYACQCGWIEASNANRLTFFAMAVHACRAGREPGAYFTYLVKEWKVGAPSGSDEDEARRLLYE